MRYFQNHSRTIRISGTISRVRLCGSKFAMRAQGANRDRTAVTVVSWVVDFLEISGQENALVHLQTIEDLNRFLPCIIELAVPDAKVKTAGSQIFAVVLG